MVYWFFSLDKANYSRWLSIYIKDLGESSNCYSRGVQEGEIHSKADQAEVFCDRIRSYSTKQLNKFVKTAGRETRIVNNDDTLTVWYKTSPMIEYILKQFSKRYQHEELDNQNHHKDTDTYKEYE